MMILRVALIASLVLLTACRKKEQEGPPPPLAVRSVEVKTGSESALELRGTVQADARLRLGFKQPGVVAAVLVKEGDVVREGQVLARLDQADARSALRVAGAALNKAKRDFQRADTLAKGGTVASSMRDDARAALDAAEANLAVALDNFKRTQLLSPVGGKIVQRVAEPGETVGPGSPVLVVDQTENLVVKLGVTDRDLARLEVGQTVSLQLEDGSPPLKGKLTSLGAAPNSTDGLYPVELTPEGDRKLQPGSLMKVRFEEAKPDEVLRIPLEAIVRRQDKDWVFVVEAAKDQAIVHLRPVKVGRSEGREIAVREGLKPGERIITEGAYFLQDNQAVRLQD